MGESALTVYGFHASFKLNALLVCCTRADSGQVIEKHDVGAAGQTQRPRSDGDSSWEVPIATS